MKTFNLLRIFFIAFTIVFASTVDAAARNTVTEPVANEVRVNQLKDRLEEIKATDMSKLSREEKKVLRAEVKEIKKEIKAISGGVYLSVGAIILIALLIILLA